jgi:hypothetical protein
MMDKRAKPMQVLSRRAMRRWALLDNDRVMVVYPDKPPKVVHPGARVEEIASTPNGCVAIVGRD